MEIWSPEERAKYLKENNIIDHTVLLPDEEAFLKVFPGGFDADVIGTPIKITLDDIYTKGIIRNTRR